MKLVSDIFERLPQVWVLVGLLFFATGLYLGFDYSLVFVYLGIGAICLAYGVVLFVLLLGERPKKSKARTLSRDFISIGSNVVMPAADASQESTSDQ
jgi:multisubunit Na+/H+ antiporter MnhC subunit